MSELIISTASKTHVGNVRAHNEDSLAVRDDLFLWVIADGMGGYSAGEVASAIAVDHIVNCSVSGKSLPESVQEAHYEICRAKKDGRGAAEMGTTVVALRFVDRTYEVAWVGDSRAYLIQNGKIRQLTKDHTLVQQYVDLGVISDNEARTHQQKHILTQALGSIHTDNINIGFKTGKIRHNDRFIICSDGLTQYVDDIDISILLSTSNEIQIVQQIESIVSICLENGGSDNISLIVVDVQINDPDYSDAHKITDSFETKEVKIYSKNEISFYKKYAKSSLFIVVMLIIACATYYFLY